MFRFTRQANWAVGGLVAASLSCGAALAQSGTPEKRDVTIAIGGVSAQMYFLPVVLADRLGYFEKAGLKVTRIDTGSGTKGLQSVVSGGADVTAGSYEHTVRMQARGQDIKAFVKFGAYLGNVLGIVKTRAAAYKNPADMKGWKIGVSSPGSSSQLFAALLLSKYNVRSDEVSYIAVTQGPGGIAAVRSGGELDAVALTDPSITELETTKDIVVVADSRTLQGSIDVYGGETIAGVFYTRGSFIEKNPNTVQALTDAVAQALDWMKTASIDDIISKLPPEYYTARPEIYRAMLEKNITGFRHDGSFPAAATEVMLSSLRKTDAELKDAVVDLTKTYDKRFIDKTRAAHPY